MGGAISGWLLRHGPGLKLLNAFNTIQSPAGFELASIWMTGFAPAIDASGNVFVVTGNGKFKRAGGDYGESVLRLPPTLNRVQDFFTPAAYQSLNNGDLDFGSGGVMPLPAQSGQTAPPLAVAMGKDAVLYLLNQSALGGVQANDAGALQATRLAATGGGVFGGPAYHAGPTAAYVYYQNKSYDRAERLATPAWSGWCGARMRSSSKPTTRCGSGRRSSRPPRASGPTPTTTRS